MKNKEKVEYFLKLISWGSPFISMHFSASASGWAGWALAHPEFGSSVNPITTRGANYAHHITASPPGFENPAAALHFVNNFEPNLTLCDGPASLRLIQINTNQA